MASDNIAGKQYLVTFV